MFLIKIVLKGGEEKLREKLERIREKDESFVFKIEKGVLEIENKTKNQAYKRGVWLVKNIEELKKCGFEVEEVRE